MEKSLKMISALVENVSNVIKGKDDKIKQIVATWISGGHVLLEDVPGTGKTLLAKALARSTNLEFKRSQFTPDLLPSDITGTMIYDQTSNKFEFLKGPLFTTFFLGDEINRATPRTQSALLESMAEGQITVDNKTYKHHDLFFVIATQNPVEQQGTFPLPEAQLDRFAIKISLGYMDKKSEIKMAQNHISNNGIDDLKQVLGEKEIRYVRQNVEKVKISDSVYEYVYNLVQATRNHSDLSLGASPRATLTLLKLGQAMSLMDGNDYLKPSTIYNLAESVLSHRIILNNEAKFSGKTTAHVLKEILTKIQTPTK